MNKSDAALLLPGTRVLMGSRRLGRELYGVDDPDDGDELYAILNSVVTVKEVKERAGRIDVKIEEADLGYILIEEIACIVDSVIDDAVELEQSDVPLSILY